MALYMLSTNVAVCLIRGTSRVLDGRIESAPHRELCICAVTRGELLCDLTKRRSRRHYLGGHYLELLTKKKAEASRLDQATVESLRSSTHAALARMSPVEAKLLRERFGIEASGRQADVAGERMGHSDQTQHLSRLVDQFLARVSCLPFDEAAATQFATVAVELHRAGTPMGTTDTMIAGHAMAVGAVLVTANEGGFSAITGLKTEDWTKEP
ncbi:MAG TPA: hypothetical protein VHY19_06620 [Steroidobacteraceae bacterium]|jgi:tRNA(fMet)-specific endonuclease VapC|nr:hypothetical protein [Steroidobacteraceae bacterium]